MSLFATDETVEVRHPSWPPDQKVFVRREMPYSVLRKIEAVVFRVRGEMGGAMDMEAEIAALQMETLRHMIVSWTLTDDAGAPVPLGPEAIDRLKGPVANYIYSEINRLTPRLSQEEQADFAGEPAPGSTDVVPLPKRRSS